MVFAECYFRCYSDFERKRRICGLALLLGTVSPSTYSTNP